MEEKVNALIKKFTKNRDVEYWQVLENIYGEQGLLPPELEAKTIGLSEGVSDYKAFSTYLEAIIYDTKTHASYRNYALPLGARSIRDVLSTLESIKFDGKFSYAVDSFCLTEGVTGAVSSIFEYIHKTYSDAEVLSHSPNYYLFKFSARHFGMTFKEVPLELYDQKETLSVDTLLASITPKTKLLIISNPHNPTGSIYAKEDLVKVIQAAKRHKILVLIDEIFNDLLFDKNDFIESDLLVHDLDAGEYAIIVKGYSKNKNLPGFRIGYAFSENKKLIQSLGDIQEVRVNFATGSNYESFIILDSLYYAIATLQNRYPKIELTKIIGKAVKLFDDIPLVARYGEKFIMKDFLEFAKYNEKLLEYYKRNYDLALSLLSPYLDGKTNTKCGFNTFFKFRDMEEVNMFDFCLNLYLTTGVMIHAGPYFGFDQKIWQKDKDLGFWFRITFALDPQKLKEGIGKLIAFREDYLIGKKTFIQTGIQL